jgi:epoxide hydrolase-like predicted phosphatase
VIQGIIFDCFGVLCHGSLGYLRSVVAPDRLQALNDVSQRSDLGYVSRDEYRQQLGMLLDMSMSEIDTIIATQCVRSEQMISLARSLRGTYKTALLSNVGRGFIANVFTIEELEGLFDTVVLSSEVGMIKPEREIYELTADRLGVSPEACVMIDDLASNIQGAEAVGMRGIICANTRQCESELRQLLGGDHA